LIATIVRGVHTQCIDGVRQRGPSGSVEVKGPTAAAACQEIHTVIGEVCDVSVGRVDGERNDAVGQHDIGAVLGHGNVGTLTGTATRYIGIRGRGYEKKHASPKDGF
jgi:hypothetical protein